jgi:hypothetical protein
VGNEEQGEPELRPELVEDLQHRRLDRDVERRGDLVADQDLGPGSEGASNRDALTFPAGELVREPASNPCGEADALEEVGDLRFGPAVRAPCQDDRRPCNRVADAVPRVQGVVGVLEDELELAPRIPRAVSDLRRERHAVEKQAPGRRRV